MMKKKNDEITLAAKTTFTLIVEFKKEVFFVYVLYSFDDTNFLSSFKR